jgi:hypothetical protein
MVDELLDNGHKAENAEDWCPAEVCTNQREQMKGGMRRRKEVTGAAGTGSIQGSKPPDVPSRYAYMHLRPVAFLAVCNLYAY